MSRKMTNSEAISNLNHIYGIVSPDIQRSLDVAIEALEERPQGEWKLVSNINNDIDVVCPFCNKTRIFSYAHGYSIEEVKSQLQEVNDLPNYCEKCGADMRGGAE